MSFCPNCGANLSDEAKFCTFCGTSVKQSNIQTVPRPITTSANTVKRPSPKLVKIVWGITGGLFLFSMLLCFVLPSGGHSRVEKSNNALGARFTCTLDEFISAYNSIADSSMKIDSSNLSTVKAMNDYGVTETQYGYSFYDNNNHTMIILFDVENDTQKLAKVQVCTSTLAAMGVADYQANVANIIYALDGDRNAKSFFNDLVLSSSGVALQNNIRFTYMLSNQEVNGQSYWFLVMCPYLDAEANSSMLVAKGQPGF